MLPWGRKRPFQVNSVCPDAIAHGGAGDQANVGIEHELSLVSLNKRHCSDHHINTNYPELPTNHQICSPNPHHLPAPAFPRQDAADMADCDVITDGMTSQCVPHDDNNNNNNDNNDNGLNNGESGFDMVDNDNDDGIVMDDSERMDTGSQQQSQESQDMTAQQMVYHMPPLPPSPSKRCIRCAAGEAGHFLHIVA